MPTSFRYRLVVQLLQPHAKFKRGVPARTGFEPPNLLARTADPSGDLAARHSVLGQAFDHGLKLLVVRDDVRHGGKNIRVAEAVKTRQRGTALSRRHHSAQRAKERDSGVYLV
jgi:hypothetical protein